jgi:hypothetical protein
MADQNFPRSTASDKVSVPEFDAYPAKSGASVKPMSKSKPNERSSAPARKGDTSKSY